MTHSTNGVATPTQALMRAVSFTGGTGLLSAVTWANIDHGGLAGSSATLAIATSAGVAIAAMTLPHVRSSALAAVFALSLVAGETSNAVAIAERAMAHRDMKSATISGANDHTVKAHQRVTSADAALNDHRKRSTELVATKGCADACRTLLQAQDDTLAGDVRSARADAAKTSTPRQANPLAHSLGWQPWALDLVSSLIASLAINGLAFALLCFASSSVGKRRENDAASIPVRTPEVMIVLPTGSDRTHEVPETGAVAATGSKQAPEQPAVVAAKSNIIRVVASGQPAPSSVRGLAKLIESSTSTTQVALAALISSGVLIRAADGLKLATDATA
jgi:hypothetical protein